MEIISNGTIITYKPEIDGTLEHDRHMVIVREARRDDLLCESVLGTQFPLSWSRVDEVLNDGHESYKRMRSLFA